MGSWEFKSDKPYKKDKRWNKTFRGHDKGTVDKAGASEL